VLANSYPLADIFVTMLEFFLFFAWIWLLIIVFGDIFRSRDLSGWGKALWVLLVAIVPLFGVLVYLIARGGKMQQRQIEAAQAQQQAFQQYVQEAASPSANGSAGQVAKLADLRDRGVISEAEFQQEKAKVLGA
jgi:Short C-terminal domain/Phospholipase_D-nuclease N-terminal